VAACPHCCTSWCLPGEGTQPSRARPITTRGGGGSRGAASAAGPCNRGGEKSGEHPAHYARSNPIQAEGAARKAILNSVRPGGRRPREDPAVPTTVLALLTLERELLEWSGSELVAGAPGVGTDGHAAGSRGSGGIYFLAVTPNTCLGQLSAACPCGRGHTLWVVCLDWRFRYRSTLSLPN